MPQAREKLSKRDVLNNVHTLTKQAIGRDNPEEQALLIYAQVFAANKLGKTEIDSKFVGGTIPTTDEAVQERKAAIIAKLGSRVGGSMIDRVEGIVISQVKTMALAAE